MRATGTSAGMCYFLLLWMERDASDGYSCRGAFCRVLFFGPISNWVVVILQQY